MDLFMIYCNIVPIIINEYKKQRCIRDLKDFAPIDLKISPPIVSFKETIIEAGKEITQSMKNFSISFSIRCIPLPASITVFLEDNAELIHQVFSYSFMHYSYSYAHFIMYYNDAVIISGWAVLYHFSLCLHIFLIFILFILSNFSLFAVIIHIISYHIIIMHLCANYLVITIYFHDESKCILSIFQLFIGK